jgi:hypothetical protein
MGILDKLGLVEEEEVIEESPESAEKAVVSDNPVIAQASEKDLASVEAIYKTTSLSDRSKSIYKVEELKNALPASLDSQAAKQSVLGVMKVAGLGKDEVLVDSDKRITALVEAKNQMAGEVQTSIQANLDEITRLEATVNKLKQANNQKKKMQEEQEASIQREIERIEAIVKFIS